MTVVTEYRTSPSTSTRSGTRRDSRSGAPELHPHDLRHPGNTLAEIGATLRELMERMGHRSTRAALIYLHARTQRDRAIADGLDAIVGTAGLGGHQTVSSRYEGHAGGTK